METIVIERHQPRVLLIRFNCPEKLNVLSAKFFSELNTALTMAEEDKHIVVIVLMSSGRAFSAGADLTQMVAIKNTQDAIEQNLITEQWEAISRCQKPVIAAVNGLALGGGFELALMCDMIIAAESARFAQPEIKVGTMPGAGGTQRLTQIIGKAKTMEMCLTGRIIDAKEAEHLGIVTKIVEDDNLESSALALAATIASYSMPVIKRIKQAVLMADETSLSNGIAYERRLFYSTFNLDDRQEGMHAFINKRSPNFRDK